MNSTALLLRMIAEGAQLDAVIMADTGEEHPRTYAFVEEYVRPFLAEHGLPFVVVRSAKGRLVDHYMDRKTVPSFVSRDCTQKFKIAPIRDYLKSIGYGPRTNSVCVGYIGICEGEAHRVFRSDVAWCRNEFPLVAAGIDREACERIIRDHGWPSPGKSACRGCPFMGKRGARQLYHEDRAEFERWARLDENNKGFPRVTLLAGGIPMRRIAARYEGNANLGAFGIT